MSSDTLHTVCWSNNLLSNSIYGLLFMGVGSIGNDVECRWSLLPIIAIVWVIFSVIGVRFATTSSRFLASVSRALAGLVVFLHICHLCVLRLPRRWFSRENNLLVRFLTKSGVMGEVHVVRNKEEEGNYD